MVTRLQQLYIGSHEEKLSAREHGFDRDFWAGSPSDRTTKRDCVRHLQFQLVWKFCHARPTCKKHGVAALHSSSTTLTMTRIFGQAFQVDRGVASI